MKLSVLALDYDGTIASDGILDPEVAAALAEARERGLTVILVTGRVVADLHRVMGGEQGGERARARLRLFDAVVAENGALVWFPDSGRSLELAMPVPAAFLAELRHRGVPFLAGDSIVDSDADRAPQLLQAIRELQLPLCLLFNRGRVMVLPQGVSKATGLREALRALRLSAHNAVAVGDAENDHALLGACELGVAVQWGSPVLRAAADEVLAGGGPADVAPFLRALASDPQLAPSRLGRRRLHLGTRDDGQPCELAVRGRNVLVAGDTRSGKSWVTGLLCEQLVLEHYCVCVVDPEGEYSTLRSLPGVVVFDADPRPPDLDDLVRALGYPDISVVVDLSAMEDHLRQPFVRSMLLRLRDLRRRTGLPHRIVVDEAQHFLHEDGAAELLELRLGGYTLVTWHVSQLPSEVLATAEAVLVTRASDVDEARRLHEHWGAGLDLGAWAEVLRELAIDQAVLLPGAEESATELVRFTLAGRITPHVRHRRKYRSVSVAPERAFVFETGGGPQLSARNLDEVVAAIDEGVTLEAHLARGDLSRWIREVMSDEVLAGDVREIELAWSQRRLARPEAALIRAFERRYGGSPE